MCALLVGLPDVVVLGVGDWPLWLRVTVTMDGERPVCSCGGAVHRHGVREVVLVDLPVFGRPTRLVCASNAGAARAVGAAGATTTPRSPRLVAR
jgi:hypothetical protein